MSTVMDELGTDDKTINNMNLIKLATWEWRFISSRVIRGSALVEMSGKRWIMLVQGELKNESFTILSPFEKTFWVVDAMCQVFEKES